MSTNPSQPPKTGLPTPRALLTSLINAISNIPLTERKPDQSRKSLLLQEESYAPANPFRRVPPSYRHLIITLHVLFPEMVLPALDLLERGLVGRVTLTTTNAAAAAVAGTGKKYLVRLGAWSCTCAAFAFAAVQGDGGMSLEEVGGEAGGMGNDVGIEWSFGGMSLDGLGQAGEGVPLCKHLLACLLAERWSAALGRYVVEWRVGREEMAGIVADM
ncbi:Zinc finger SWIM domain-containing protein 7 [Madurella mycetomatis]|uniref:Zinc finger SWIM domain-containing protein 7 n=1 Tax=Madurella mycetomatis TaxID=100816 RepID=A0A175WA96_9PEZI|nr:Zinc finger SWIM domain-containing protein 7 [Madurella mycetomatis]